MDSAPLTLGRLASLLGCELWGDPDTVVFRVAPLADAGPGDLSFIANRVYRGHLTATRASAVVAAPEDAAACPVDCLVHDNPYAMYALAAIRLHPRPRHAAGVHASAVVEAGALVDANASVGPHAYIAAGATVAAGARVGPGCVLGANSRLGADAELTARVTVEPEVWIGERCLVHPGVVLGGDGFGFARDRERWVKVPQLGRVVIGDDVEIGANTTIDRGTMGDTRLGDGVKLDNLIQIAHNVQIGDHTAIAAMSGVAGSTRIGARCQIGGQVGISGHLQIADGVAIAAQSLVTRSIPRAGHYAGVPAEEVEAWRRSVARVRRLQQTERRLRALEQQLGLPAVPDGSKDSA